MVSDLDGVVCPHCASEALGCAVLEHDNHDEYAIVCYNCGAVGPDELTRELAIQMYKMRRPMEVREREIDAGWNDVALELRARAESAEASLVELAEAIANEFENWPDGERWYVDAARRVLKTYRPDTGEG